MRTTAPLLFVLAALTAASAAAQNLVYRVDQATAAVDGRTLVVTAEGAVRGGGWEHPKLVRRKQSHEPDYLEISFVATPPGNASVVSQSILPVKVSFKTRLPKGGVETVKIVSETNSITAKISLPQKHRKTAKK
jgi:hypothetical protein